MPKIIRITTSPLALKYLLSGQMKFMKGKGFEVIMISADGKEVKDVIKSEGCKHVIVPMTRRITPLKDFICLVQLIRIFKREKPDIVHSHTPKAGLLGMMAAYFCSVKIRIHTVAGLPLMSASGLKLSVLKMIEKLTYSCATHIWPNSFSLKKYIEENNFVKSEKLEVIGKGSSNGIDLSKFDKDNISNNLINEIKTIIGYSLEKIYLLFVGRMVGDKGISELVRSFKKLSFNYPCLSLILVGPFEEELDPLPVDILQEIKNNESITHIEWSEQVAALMATCNYFIFPSHREGFPNVLLQAGAIGIPVICSEIPGNIDIVDDGITGYLFRINDEKSLEKAILRGLLNPEKAQKNSVLLKKNIFENFDRNKLWFLILEKYNKLLQDNR